jgi:hypothetical protein
VEGGRERPRAMGSRGPEGKEGRKDRSLPKGRENRLTMASTWRLRIDFKTALEYFMILGLIV